MNSPDEHATAQPHVYVHHRHAPYGSPPPRHDAGGPHHDKIGGLADELNELEAEVSRIRRRITELHDSDD